MADVGVGIADVHIIFEDISKAEKKNYNFVMEAKAVHDAAVKQWDMLFEAIQKLAKEHKDSPSFKDSQMYKKWFEPVKSIDVKYPENESGTLSSSRLPYAVAKD